MLRTISKCNKCDQKADTKDGDVLLCTDHWFEIYARGYVRKKLTNRGIASEKPREVTYLPTYLQVTSSRGNL